MRSQAFDNAAQIMLTMCQQEYLPGGYAAFDLDLNCLGWFRDLDAADGLYRPQCPSPIVCELPLPTDDDPHGQCRGHLAAALIFEVETCPWRRDENPGRTAAGYQARLEKCQGHLGEVTANA